MGADGRKPEEILEAAFPARSPGATLAEAVAGWHTATSGEEAATLISRGALSLAAGAEAAGLVRLWDRGRRLSGQGQTDDTAAALTRLQAELDDGPCRHAVRTRRPVAMPTMTGDTRWPGFAARASELGVAGMLSLPLRIGDRDLGTLDLLARTPGAFDAAATEPLVTFSLHAALAVHARTVRADLGRAMESRDRIGQAKGILMARHGITAELAFLRLVAASQASNTKLVEVAAHVVDEQLSSTGAGPATAR